MSDQKAGKVLKNLIQSDFIEVTGSYTINLSGDFGGWGALTLKGYERKRRSQRQKLSIKFIGNL